MAFLPAHKAVVLYSLEPGVGTSAITESADGTEAAKLTDVVGVPTAAGVHTTLPVLGYTNLPQASRGLNNTKGFAIGQQGAAYNKRGLVQPQIDIEIRPGNVGLLQHLVPNASGELPYLCLYVAVQGQYTDI